MEIMRIWKIGREEISARQEVIYISYQVREEVRFGHVESKPEQDVITRNWKWEETERDEDQKLERCILKV